MGQNNTEINDLFGVPIRRGENRSLSQHPALYASMFDAQDAYIGDQPCIMLYVKGDVRLRPLMKAVDRLRMDTDTPCIVVAPQLSVYQRSRLSEEGIAWLSSSETFHIPFLGMASTRKPKLYSRSAMGSRAFHLLAEYLTGRFDEMSTQQVAKAIGKSLSSTNDYFIELNSFFPGIVGSEGRKKFLQPAMRSEVLDEMVFGEGLSLSFSGPQKKYYRLDFDPNDLMDMGFKRAGLTALSDSTMIGDNPWLTLAIGKRAFRDSTLLKSAIEVSPEDDPNLLVEVWPYELSDREGEGVLPLEIWLSLRENAQYDDRIADSLEQMMRGRPYGSDGF